MDEKETEHWYVVRKRDRPPEMYVVAYTVADADTYLPLLTRDLSHGSTVEPVTDPALVARLSACVDDTLDGVEVTEISHAWHAESGFAHAHN